MTRTIVEALEKVQSPVEEHSTTEREQIPGGQNKNDEASQGDGNAGEGARVSESALAENTPYDGADGNEKKSGNREPRLSTPQTGNPISHGQVIDLWKQLKASNLSPTSLETLLRGSRVYIPPPATKPEPTSEYKALMARLRREEEARSYQRMTNPTPPMETFAQRFPLSSAAHAFASSQQPLNISDQDADAVTYADVDRQMVLILNVAISILACAAAIWIAAKWWSTPARLALSFSGSLLVGIAEVVVYSGYIRRVGDAKGKEKGIEEIKEVVNTWVVGGGEDEDDGVSNHAFPIKSKEGPDHAKARKRK